MPTRIFDRCGIAVFLSALLVCSWVTRLEFQLDDLVLIREAGPKLHWSEPVDPPSVSASQTYSFRPTLWMVLFAVARLASPEVRAWPFHLTFLIAHAAAAWLLYHLLSARVARVPATIAGLLFGILPGGIQAVSWIAGGGDQLAVLFTLAACAASDAAMRKPSALRSALCGAAVLAALASKETAIVLLPPCLLLVWAAPPRGVTRTRGALIRIAIAAAGAVPIAWVLRGLYLGEWLPKYWGGESLQLSHLALLPTVLAGYLMPWDPACTPPPLHVTALQALGAAAHAASRAALVIFAALPPALGLVFGAPKQRLAVAALAITFVIVLLPLVPIVRSDGLGLSRACYAASAVLAALFGVSASTARKPATDGPPAASVGPPAPAGSAWQLADGPPAPAGSAWQLADGPPAPAGSAWQIAMAAPFVLLSLDVHQAIARGELRTAIEIGVARDAYRAALGPRATPLMLEPPSWQGTIPFLGSPFVMALSPPFGRSTHQPAWWPRADTIHRWPAISSDPNEIRVLEWDGRRLVTRMILGAIPPALPLLTRDAAAASRFRPRSAVPARAVAGAMIDLGASSSRPLTAVFKTRNLTRQIPFSPPSAGRHVIGIPDAMLDAAWLSEDELVSLEIEGAEVTEVPVLIRSLPPIRLHCDAPPDRLPFERPPTFEVSAEDVAAPILSVLVELVIEPGAYRVPIRWSARRDALPGSSPGRLRFTADGPASVTIEGRTETTHWNAVVSRIMPHAHGESWTLSADVLVEGVDESGVDVTCRSERVAVVFGKTATLR